MPHRPWLFALLVSALLVGCNNDGDPRPEPEPKTQQRGFGESELHDPVHRPDGHFIKPGQTAILELEGVNGTPTPSEGDTATAGVDELWFEISAGGNLDLSIREETLATIAQAELWNTTGGMLIRVNADTRQGSAELTPGRYGLRLYAAHTQEHPLNLFIQVQEVPDEPATANRTLQTNGDEYRLLAYGNCPDCDLTQARLMRVNLPGANLARANLTEATLSFANLTQADLSFANLTGATLYNANLTEANLTKANLTKAFLYEANLSGADLTAVSLAGADLTAANLSGASLSGANLYKARLNFANLSGVDLSGANLSEAVLQEARLVQANLTQANLTGAYLFGVNLTGADLEQANLTGADLEAANLSGATWTDGRICAEGSVGQCR